MPAAPSSIAPRAWPPILFAWAALALVLVPDLWLHPPWAQNDLLRNVVGYAWHYHYPSLYPAAPGMPDFDPYLGFDLLLAPISRAVGPAVAMHAAQLAGTLAVLAALLGPLGRLPHAGERRLVALALVVGTVATSRFVGGRPELWATAWLLSAASLSWKRWLALGVILAPLYWLMPLYAVGGFLLQRSWRERGRVAIAAAALTGGVWFLLGGTEWLPAVAALPGLTARRAVAVAEAAPLTTLLRHPGTWLLGAALVATALRFRRRATGLEFLPAAAFFLATGSARHVLVLAPLAALWIARQDWPAPGLRAWSFLPLLAVVGGVLGLQQLPDARGPRFALPARSLVLAGYNPAVFMLPFANPGRIAVLPSVEPGWDDPEAARLAQRTMTGTLSCTDLATTGITHVVTPTRVRLSGDCLAPVGTEPGWTLWRVRHPARRGAEGASAQRLVEQFPQVP